MRRLTSLMVGMTLALAALGVAPAQVLADASRPRPNIVFIFADDWGWGDLSCHGNTWLATPHLDRLAGEGIDFQQFNVLNPVCSPSRTAVMTGHSPARYCIHEHFASPEQNRRRGMPDWLDARAPTLPRLLKQAGYRTAHFGKWHLTNRETKGAPRPEAYGYDEAKVFNGAAEWPVAPVQATADDTVAFIAANADRPFFVNVWLHEPHTPHVPTPTSLEKWKHLPERQRVYAAVITDGDAAVGKILAALRVAGVDDNTLVMFSSDNGPESPSPKEPTTMRDGSTAVSGYDTSCSVGETGGLRGRKRSLLEGGVRVPFLVRWPGHAPAGLKNDTTVFTAVDLLPTLCAAAGVELPAEYRGDGENLLDAFDGKLVRRTRPILWQWRGKADGPDLWPRLAVRDGDWKLVLDPAADRAELYDLNDDRGEARNVAAAHPDVVARLSALALEWRDSLPARPDETCIALAAAPASAADAANAYPDPVTNPSAPLMMAGDWVPANTAKIDFKMLPVIPSRHAIVHDVRDEDGNRVNQHNYLAFHAGRYWAMWSDGPGQPNRKLAKRLGSHRNIMPGHDGIPAPGQPPNKVYGAMSPDGITWSKPFDIAGEPAANHGWFARGYWIRDGKLLALASQFEPPDFQGPGLSLQAFELIAADPPTWRRLGLVCDDTLNNFPPQKLPAGEWMVSRRNGRWETFTMIGGVKAIDDWIQIPIVGTEGKDGFKPDEPIWWTLPDGNQAFLFRDNTKGGFLYRAFSTDDGRSWSEPVRTNFPDATSKFSGCRLADGRYVLVSNAKPGVRDPLVLSVSPDGLVFRQMGVLVAGRHVDYPHVIEHDGHLFVAFASAKQSVEVLKIELSALDVLQPVAAR